MARHHQSRIGFGVGSGLALELDNREHRAFVKAWAALGDIEERYALSHGGLGG